MRLIRAVHLSGRSLAELIDALPRYVATPELRFAVDAGRREAVVGEVLARLREEAAEVDTTDGVRVREADGWWLLRASNTQDLLTARAEGVDEGARDRLVARIDAQLAASGVRRG